MIILHIDAGEQVVGLFDNGDRKLLADGEARIGRGGYAQRHFSGFAGIVAGVHVSAKIVFPLLVQTHFNRIRFVFVNPLNGPVQLLVFNALEAVKDRVAEH